MVRQVHHPEPRRRANHNNQNSKGHKEKEYFFYSMLYASSLTPETLIFGAWSSGFQILHSLRAFRWISEALLGWLAEVNGDPMDTLAE
jgi:hypothetical protein